MWFTRSASGHSVLCCGLTRKWTVEGESRPSISRTMGKRQDLISAGGVEPRGLRVDCHALDRGVERYKGNAHRVAPPQDCP